MQSDQLMKSLQPAFSPFSLARERRIPIKVGWPGQGKEEGARDLLEKTLEGTSL